LHAERFVFSKRQVSDYHLMHSNDNPKIGKISPYQPKTAKGPVLDAKVGFQIELFAEEICIFVACLQDLLV
jgi:hypothetical protein